jgi:glycosyltransferase involved in cell wall biosynthesis
MDNIILKKSTEIITISSKMKNYLMESRYLKENKIKVIRNWQNDDIFINYKDKHQNNNKFTFMYLGSINPTAGVDLLINAFGESNLKEARLIIAGSGSDKEKCIKIAKSHHDKTIEFHEVSGKEVPNMQSKADVLLLPLKKGVARTALPSKLTAYMLSAKPIIASIDLDSEPADMIRDNTCGFVIEPENKSQLIKCMENITKLRKEKLLSMGENSSIYAKEHLSKRHNLSKLTTIIQNTKREITNA